MRCACARRAQDCNDRDNSPMVEYNDIVQSILIFDQSVGHDWTFWAAILRTVMASLTGQMRYTATCVGSET